ncbi:MAG: hypothetical protein IEMM0008_0364 [bacterium]|nr:MAG: hypothetical protein IEMM0008_0364 [bacterium]
MVSKYLSNLVNDIYQKTIDKVTYLVAVIKHPTDESKNIEIESCDCELTIYFWEHHDHIFKDSDDNLEKEFKELVGCIDAIMNDKIYFSATYRDDRCINSMSSDNIEDHMTNKKGKTIIKSWSGKYDHEIKA